MSEFPPDELLPAIERAADQQDVPAELQALADEHAAKVAEKPDYDDSPEVPYSGEGEESDS